MKKSLFFCVEKSEGKEMGCEIRYKKRCVQGNLLASTSYCSSVRVSKKMMMYFLFLFLNTKVYYYSVAQYESKSVKENDDLYFIFYIFYMHIFIIIILKVATFYFF